MRQLFLSFLLVGTLTAGAQSTTASQVARISTDDAVERPLFKTFPGEIPYRIPAIAVNRRGELIAVSDYRPCGGDIGFGKVDLRYRISEPRIRIGRGRRRERQQDLRIWRCRHRSRPR